MNAVASRPSIAPGAYLTDGSKLFRVCSLGSDGERLTGEVEDCRTLEAQVLTLEELEVMRLVKPAPEPAE